MRYACTFRWNGTITMHGTTSATIAHALLQHSRENFAGSSFNQLGSIMPTLAELATAGVGQRFSYTFNDGTGTLFYELECIAPRKG